MAEPEETVTIPLADLISLVAAARIYIDAFADDEQMSITERLALQDVEDAVERWKQPEPADPFADKAAQRGG